MFVSAQALPGRKRSSHSKNKCGHYEDSYLKEKLAKVSELAKQERLRITGLEVRMANYDSRLCEQSSLWKAEVPATFSVNDSIKVRFKDFLYFQNNSFLT